MQWFWWFMLIFSLLIPTVMVVFGVVFMHKTPKKINTIFGYRTRRSMKDEKSWDYAHHYFGRLWAKWGSIIFFLSIIILINVSSKSVETISWIGFAIIMGQLIIMFTSILMTEKELKSKDK